MYCVDDGNGKGTGYEEKDDSECGVTCGNNDFIHDNGSGDGDGDGIGESVGIIAWRQP